MAALAPGEASALPGLATVIGHRGAAARAPENTLAGLRKAKELGAGWVEFDVMLSRDGVPVLIHDETLQRTTNGRGRVARHTADEIRSLDAGRLVRAGVRRRAGAHPGRGRGLLLELGLNANVEIKPSSGQAGADRRGRGRICCGAWAEDGPRLLLSSFERTALRARSDAWRRHPRGLLAVRLPADWAQAMQALGCATLHLDHRRIGTGNCASWPPRVPVLLYTVNDAQPGRASCWRPGPWRSSPTFPTCSPASASSGASTRPAGPGS